jgi:hypothetical protein
LVNKELKNSFDCELSSVFLILIPFVSRDKYTLRQKQMASKESNVSVENVKTQIASYGNQIQDFLSATKIDIQQYRLLVEKNGNGVNIDIAFKATISSEREKEEMGSSLSNP